MPALVALASQVVIAILNSWVARWIAEKAFWTFMICVVIPIILNNWMYDLVSIGLQLLNENQPTSVDGIGGIWQLTSVGAWLAIQLKLPDALSVLLSAVALRVYMRLANPIVRW